MSEEQNKLIFFRYLEQCLVHNQYYVKVYYVNIYGVFTTLKGFQKSKSIVMSLISKDTSLSLYFDFLN